MKKSPSFPAIWLAVGAALLLHSSGDLASASGLLPGEGKTLVFERSYTKAHLAKHPKQVVQSMRLRLTLSADGQRVLARFSARKRTEPDAEYSIGGHTLLPVDPACLPLVLNPARAGGQVSVELRADGAIRVRVIGHADLRFASGKAPPSPGEGDKTGLWRLTADDEENAVFKLLPAIGGGNESPAPRAIPVGAGAASKSAPALEITAGGIGPLTIGAKIGELKIPPPLRLHKTTMKVRTEEGDSLETRYELRDGERVVLQIEPGFDLATGRFTDLVEVIKASSVDCRTAEGLGPGSTLSKLAAAYSKPRLWYTYVSEMFVFETPDLPGVQFLLDPKGYKGDRRKLTASDLVVLEPAAFSPTTSAIAVRILRTAE